MIATRSLCLFGLSLTASGCTVVSSAANQERLDGLLGVTETELIRQFGPPMEPDAEDQADLGDSLYWESEHLVEQTSSSSSGGISFGMTIRCKHHRSERLFPQDGALTRVQRRQTRMSRKRRIQKKSYFDRGEHEES